MQKQNGFIANSFQARFGHHRVQPTHALVLLLVTLLGGCSPSPIIHSSYAAPFSPDTSPPAGGFTYHLPRKMADIVVERVEITSDLKSKTASQVSQLTSKLKLLNSDLLEATKKRDRFVSAYLSARGNKELKAATVDRARDVAEDAIAYAAGVAKEVEDVSKKIAAASPLLATKKKWMETLSFKLGPTEPDPDARLIAQNVDSILQDANLKLVAKNGLLSNADATTVDRTADVATKIVGLAGIVLGVGGASTPFSSVGVQNILGDAPSDDEKPSDEKDLRKSIKQAFRLNPTDPCQANWLDNWLTENLFSISVEMEGVTQEALALKCDKSGLIDSEKVANYNEVEGLIYRRSIPHRWYVSVQEAGDVRAKMQRLDFVAPSKMSEAYVPMLSAPLVATKHALVFDNGELVSVELDKPSTALAAASWPIDAIKAFVSVPTEILKLRVDYDSTANLRAQEQIKLIEAQTDILKAQRSLDATLADETLTED